MSVSILVTSLTCGSNQQSYMVVHKCVGLVR